MQDQISIKFLKWSDYQPRKDMKSLAWFRVESSLFDGETYYNLGNQGLIIFIFLLSVAAKKNNDEILINLNFVSEKLKIKKEAILKEIEKLEQLQIVHKSVQIRTNPYGIVTNITLHNEHNITNITEHNNTLHNEHNIISSEPKNLVADVVVDKINISISKNHNALIKQELIDSWTDTYDAEFLKQSMKEMKNWILANSHKAPKSNWSKFMNDWFKRGWEQYRKSLGSNKPNKITQDDLDSWIRGEL